MDECCLITVISGIACAITKSCSDDDISILTAALTQLGDTLATYLTQKEIREKRQKDYANKKNTENEIPTKIKTDKDTDINQEKNSNNNEMNNLNKSSG